MPICRSQRNCLEMQGEEVNKKEFQGSVLIVPRRNSFYIRNTLNIYKLQCIYWVFVGVLRAVTK